MTKHIERFAEYLKTSDALLEQASKEEISDAARVLAFHLGHYRTRYCDIPTTESLHLLTTETITDEIAVTLVSGLEALIGVLKALRTSVGPNRIQPSTRHYSKPSISSIGSRGSTPEKKISFAA